MLAIATFWLLLCLPGYVLLRRLCPQALESGLLGAIGLGYLASFVLLSPISIVGYLFRLPLWVLSIAIVIAVAASVVSLLHDLLRNRPKLRFDATALIAACIVAADMIMGLRAGSFFRGDGNFHMARIRMLLTFGFNSWDPVIPSRHLDLTYHSNLYHALIASSAQLTRQSVPEAWGGVLFWAKLMAAAGVYQLAYTVLGRRFIAWIAAATFAVFMATYSVVAYPNTVVVYGFLTLALAFLIEALTGPRSYWPAIGIAATSVVVVEWHALYHVFACLLLGPSLLFGLVRLQLRRLPGRRELAIALFALGLGAPWFAVRAWPAIEARMRASHREQAQSSVPGPPQSEYPEPEWSYTEFVRLGGGRLMMDPKPFLDPRSPQFSLLAMLALGAFSRRRARFGVVAGALAVAIMVLYVPAICTAFVHAAGAAWIVRRLSIVFTAVQLALFPGTVVLMLAERTEALRRGLQVFQAALPPLALVSALTYAYVYGVDYAKWTKANYSYQARTRNNAQKEIARRNRVRQFLSEHIERDSVVAMAGDLFANFPECDCYPLALPESRGSHGLPDMPERRAALHHLLNLHEPLASNIDLLRHYRVRYLLLRSRNERAYRKVYRPIIVDDAQGASLTLFKVDPGKLARNLVLRSDSDSPR